MAVHTLINQLSTEALDALIKDISSKIIKDPELDPKAVSKSLAVLKALIVLNKTLPLCNYLYYIMILILEKFNISL